LSSDLLPDWYDDWMIFEAEEWRQLRLHALEALATGRLPAERFGDAAEAALAAIHAEPLRESARAVLIRIHRSPHWRPIRWAAGRSRFELLVRS
jgi:two-component SAPR family response regulator